MTRDTTVQIRVGKTQSDDCIAVNHSLLTAWGLQPLAPIKVRIGQRSFRALATLSDEQEAAPTVTLPKSLLKPYYIPRKCALQARFSDDTLQLGPVVGVLSPESSPFATHLMKVKSVTHPMILYRFSFDDVDWDTMTVKGEYLTKSAGGMVKKATKKSPFPHIIINQIRSRKTHLSRKYLKFKRRLSKRTNSLLFNPFFFNKRDVHRQLSSDIVLKHYLPQTLLSPELEEARSLIKQCSAVYFKPVDGHFGYYIYKVKYNANKRRYLCQASFKGSKIKRSYKSLIKLLTKERIDLSRYIVQQDIQLARFGKEMFDFRLHMNKDGRNSWKVAAFGANLNKPRKITTHGGWIKPGGYVLKEVFKERASDIEDEMREAAERIGEVVEQAVGRELGDLGIDMGVDKNGRIWIFEVNSFPGRHIFLHRLIKPHYKQSDRMLLDYTQYLYSRLDAAAVAYSRRIRRVPS